jgi:diguanylate cyclase (GGDEF)-like protein
MDTTPLLSLSPRRSPLILWSTIAGMVLAGLLLGYWWSDIWPARGETPAALQPIAWLGGLLLVALPVYVLVSRRSRAGAVDPLRDPVSGLYRREHADAFIGRQLAREERAGVSRLALVLIRIDYLNDIRERHADAVVDEVIGLVGGLVQGQTREGDLPVRHAADLIAVYLDCDEIDQAQAFGRRISVLLMNQQLDRRGDVIKVDVSLGIALRAGGEDINSLFRRAMAGFSRR